ncbi:MAG TPA: fibronectin type III domain-containing protein, partial [Thermoanaerobaculia bacterium]|nr:fibronectin type III domain-containing protein [Thermoanaerobaculia bacterium]
DFNSGRVIRADILPGGQIASVDIWATGIGNPTDMDVGPDGNLYVAGIGDKILQFAFKPTAQGLVVSRRFLRTSEGSVAAFSVRLAMAPDAGVSVTVTRTAGDTDLSVTQGASLTFTAANWATPQIVHVSSAQDLSVDDQVATITVSSPGLASEDVVVRATSLVPLPSPPAAPANLLAEATSATTVSLTWSAAGGATQYEIERSSAGTAFQYLTSVQGLSHVDTTAAASTAYLYRVRATNAGGKSSYGNVDLATTVIFTDDPLVVQVTAIRAVHLLQLRTAVDAVRKLAGLSDGEYTDEILDSAVAIKRVHVIELATALNDGRTGLMLTPIVEPSITAGVTTVQASHIHTLRAGVQ